MTGKESAQELDTIQRWMLSVITHPEGVAGGVGSEEALRHINVPADGLEQIIECSRSLTSAERLQVYANAYYARLIECLSDEFPALLHILGEEAFNGFAFEYLQSFPPRSYTLNQLGKYFPRFLEETRPHDTQQDTGTANWADFLIDLATLERTYSEVFDAPGTEESVAIRPDDLAAISPKQWPNVRLVPVACLRLLALRFPVHEFASAVRTGESSAVPFPSPTFLIVTRRNYLVRPRAVSRLEFEALKALCAGATVGTVVSELAEQHESSSGDLGSELRAWFESWSADGLFHEITVQ